MFFANTPNALAFAGTFRTTTLFGAIFALSPIFTFPIILHPKASSTLSPIVATLLKSYKFPIITSELFV